MDYILSRHKLTFDPLGAAVVLVDFASLIDKDVALSLAKSCDLAYPVDAKTGFIQDMDTSIWTGTVKVYQTEELDVTALVNAMQSHVTASAWTKKPLRIAIQGHVGHYWQFAQSFIKGHAPDRVTESGRARWVKTYEIVATGISYV